MTSHRPSLPQRVLPALPAHVLNGLSVAVGLVLVCGVVGQAGGLHAALAVSAGAAAVSIADTPLAPRAKLAQMLPACVNATLAAALVLATHGSPPGLAAAIVVVAAISVAWLAYGPRGGPQGFVPVLMLVFQIAALQGGAVGHRWALLGWAVLGSALYTLWALLSARALASRYRRLGLASCLDAVAGVTRAQAAYTADTAAGLTDAPGVDTLLPLVRDQAAMAEVLQRARDLLYDLPDAHPDAPLAAALVHLIELRDQLLACQLDLETVAADAVGRLRLPRVAEALAALAARLSAQAEAVRRGRTVPGPIDVDEAVRLLRPAAADPGPPAQLRFSLASRLGMVGAEHARLSAALQPGRSLTMPLPAALRQGFLSPRDWPLAPLNALVASHSPLRRYMWRAMAAFATAYVVALWLPWVSHKHWVLLTVAVVLRGSLEQTLARRDARLLGTLVGCAVAALMFALGPSQAVLLGATALAIAVAHAYVLVDYRLAAVASAIMGLSQSHIWAGAERFAVPERIADTMVGVAIAWGFCYVLPSWERQLLPGMTERLLNAEADYARHALIPAALRGAERGWRLARREVYDALWMLSQTLQRASREPRSVRPALPAIESLLLHGYRLTSQLAALRGLLAQHHGRLDPARAEPALRAAGGRFDAALRGRDASASDRDEATGAVEDVGECAPEPAVDPTPLLLRRLVHANREADSLARAAAALRGGL